MSKGESVESAYLPTAEAHRNKAQLIALRQKLWLDGRCVHDLAAGGGVEVQTLVPVENKVVHPYSRAILGSRSVPFVKECRLQKSQVNECRGQRGGKECSADRKGQSSLSTLPNRFIKVRIYLHLEV